MLATLYLLSSILWANQFNDRGDWLLTPRFTRAQEFLYRGEYSEESLGHGTRCLRTNKLKSRLLVLAAGDHDFEVAALTLISQKDEPTDGAHDGQPLFTKLETVKFDNAGRMLAPNAKALLAPLDGPATIEFGFITEVPRDRIGTGKRWNLNEDGRTQRTWEVAGTDEVNGITCVKLVGKQQSPDWDKPRGDRVGWQRTDTVWIAPRQGIAQQIERVILRRDPGHDDPTQRLTTKYQLDNTFQYSDDRFEPRRLEIKQAREFWDTALPLLANPQRSTTQCDALLGRIDYHLQKNAETPYREAILRVKRRVEAAKRGETFVDVDQTDTTVTIVTVGKPAPDFIAPSMTKQESTQFKQLTGKPMVMIFYNPAAPSSADVLPFADTLARKYPQAAIVGMAMSDDRDKVQEQLTTLKIGIPVLCGTGLFHTYGVESTPKAIIIDDKGFVRETCLGWSLGVQESIRDELRKCLNPKGR